MAQRVTQWHSTSKKTAINLQSTDFIDFSLSLLLFFSRKMHCTDSSKSVKLVWLISVFAHETQRNCSKVDGMPVDNGNVEQNFVGIHLYTWVGRDNKRRMVNGTLTEPGHQPGLT